MTTKLKTSRRIATVWVVISMFIAVLIGIIGNSVTKAGKIPFLGTSSDAETIIIKLSDLLSQHGVFLRAGGRSGPVRHPGLHHVHRRLPAAGRRLQRVSRPGAGLLRHRSSAPRSSMLAARGTVIGIAVVGILLAWNPSSSVFRDRVLRLGRLRRGLRPAGPLLPVLEADQRSRAPSPAWSPAARWSSSGSTCMAPMGGAWSIYELLPAFLVRLRRHRRRLPGHPRPCQGDRGGIRGRG